LAEQIASSADGARVAELDTVRGLAALSVAVVHSTHVFAVSNPTQSAILTGLDVISGSQIAVILFFVLSGYVLTNSLTRSPSFVSFGIRRIVRLIIPVAVAVALCWLVRNALPLSPLDTLSADLQPEAHLLTVQDLVENLLLISFKVNAVTWTILTELAGSLLLPFFVFGTRRGSSYLWATLLLVAIGIAFRNNNVLGYLYCFAFGSVVASGHLRWARLPSVAAIGLLCVFVVPLLALPGSLERLILALSATTIVAWTASQRPTFLRASLLLWLGRISFSFYLLHPAALFIVAFACLSVGVTGFGASIVVLTVSVCLAVVGAEGMFRVVEHPSIVLGKLLTSRRPVPSPT
jgi:peptidoglycan/LPS O-acetylase OafA/YrhL